MSEIPAGLLPTSIEDLDNALDVSIATFRDQR